jgi:hypothetical protein
MTITGLARTIAAELREDARTSLAYGATGWLPLLAGSGRDLM